jgi:hypothetical protein
VPIALRTASQPAATDAWPKVHCSPENVLTSTLFWYFAWAAWPAYFLASSATVVTSPALLHGKLVMSNEKNILNPPAFSAAAYAHSTFWGWYASLPMLRAKPSMPASLAIWTSVVQLSAL